VLLIEHEPAILNRTAALVLAEGCDLSTARVADGLTARVDRLKPDLILMDVLLPALDTRELARLAARCRGGAEPVLVVHTKMLRPMLRRVLDLRTLFGFIPKSDDDREFTHRFQEIIDRLQSEMPTQVFVPRALGVVMSGTYAVSDTPTAANRARARRHG
jgi:CheY-like chemotaxis protein